MARLGIDYTSVKQQALKLLSQGLAPSVQKIREALGTGSNTTIAEHLKTWRDEHAQKAIHHLPAHLPPELIASIEVLWQTAMGEAEKHFIHFKNEIETQHDKMQQEHTITEQTIVDLKSKIVTLDEQLAQKNQENHTLQIELALAKERTAQLQDTLTQHENQFESRLKRAYNEKNEAVEKTEHMQREIEQHRQQLSQESAQHHAALVEQRALQEESEKRWLNLIDQARSESKEQRKRYDSALEKQAQRIEILQTGILEHQSQWAAQQTTLAHQTAVITELNEQLKQTQALYNEASLTLKDMKRNTGRNKK